jgi:hypothetical protein
MCIGDSLEGSYNRRLAAIFGRNQHRCDVTGRNVRNGSGLASAALRTYADPKVREKQVRMTILLKIF